MKYIAILDYQRLDNGMFMKSFSEAMGRQRGCSGIILHGDSEYTERLIQTGMLREDAVLRSTRDLNHRIVALLADSGVAGIGINGYQRKIVTTSGKNISLNREWLETRPAGTHIVLSNLVWDNVNEKVVPVPLSNLAHVLSLETNREVVIVFSQNDSASSLFVDQRNPKSSAASPDEADIRLPDDIQKPPANCYFGTTDAFGNLPNMSEFTRIS